MVNKRNDGNDAAKDEARTPIEIFRKLCRSCGKSKPLEEFHDDKNTKDGKHVFCKTCRNAYQRKLSAVKKAQREANGEVPKKRPSRNLRCPLCGETSTVRFQPRNRNFACRCGCRFTRADAEAAMVVEEIPAFKREPVEVMGR